MIMASSSLQFRVLLIFNLCFINLQLNRHINTHTGEKLFKCGLCNYGTDHSTNYRRHMERHTRKQGTIDYPNFVIREVYVHMSNTSLDVRHHKFICCATSTALTQLRTYRSRVQVHVNVHLDLSISNSGPPYEPWLNYDRM